MGDITTDALQQDIYQRYTVLARLLTSVFPRRDDAQVVTVLDIGSGPERLTERFLPGHFRVTRADVNTFGDEGVVALTRGASLPFESHSFAAVIAIEVLEHVPASERDALVGECARVSSDLVVLCCPVASEPTTRAEEIFQSLAAEISGSASPFLAEHKSNGLPDAAAVRAALERRVAHVIELPNAPLAEWLVYNLIDLAYACDFGDTDEKARFNARVNARTPLVAEGSHYRRFFAGCSDPLTRERVVEAARHVSGGKTDPMDPAIRMADAVVRFRADLLRKHEEGMRDALQAKDAHIQALDRIITTLQNEQRHATALRDQSVGEPRAHADVPLLPVRDHEPARRVDEAAPHARRDGSGTPRRLLHRAHSRIRTFRFGRRVPRQLRELVARSGLFDTEFYRAQYPDVAASGVNPLVHYLSVGAGEGRNPHPLFDGAFYLAQAPGVGSSGINPLIHYIRHGGAEGLAPHPLFDSRFYVSCHPEAAEGESTPLAHYLATGRQTRWDPSPVFSGGYYLDTNPDVAAAGINPLAHYVLLGAREGRNPNPLFDAVHYRALVGAVLAAGADPLVHYLSEGAAAGYDPHPLFSTRYYLGAYPDVAAAGVNPLSHYLLHGGSEARSPNPLFDAAWYLAAAPLPAGSNPLVHYLREGQFSGHRPHPLFDAAFYMAAHPGVASCPAGALEHYLATGASTRWDPSALFWAGYYLERYPDVAAAGANPLVHYVLSSGAEGRNPNPLFDGAYYLARNPDVAESGANPLVHYLLTGAAEGRKPSALFDTSFYLEHNPDVADAGNNPLAHYLVHGRKERRRPNALFDPDFYLSAHPDVSASHNDPLLHFVEYGAAAEFDPSESFDTSYYLNENPDVAAAGLNPLAHYLDHGRDEGRRARAPETWAPPTAYRGFVPPVGLLPWFNPLNLRVEPRFDNTPALNVLIPGLAMEHMSGGPNTALHLAYRLALEGVRIRLISTDAPMSPPHLLWEHLLRLTGGDQRLRNIEFVDAHDRRQPLVIGRNDVFFATAWWTAQMAKYATELTRHQQFVYLVQDYEPLLHAASTSQALAEETYSLDFLPIVNSRLLFDFLTANQIGRFADREFADKALVFEPAVDRSKFFVEVPDAGRPRRLLFYARPTKGLRNLFELGIAALMDAVARGAFSDTPWELLAMGEPISPVDLGHGITLVAAPWREFEGYAAQMRQADALLSLMLSPHPSYPPLEMAACGGLTVTTTFGSKTAERLASVSDRSLGAPATIEGVADAIVAAVARVREGRNGPAGGALDLPSTWDESLKPIVPPLHSWLLRTVGAPVAQRASGPSPPGTDHVACGFERWPGTAYETFRLERVRRRRASPRASELDPGLISLVTTAWNTDPQFLDYLARSVFQQDGAPRFEWVIVDNGTDREDTRHCLAKLATHPAVRVHRVEQNLGIAGGMRLGLELARNRYILPVDSDDYLYPDCLQLVGHALTARGFPPLLYTDEDKFNEHEWRDPYFKPDWDPVLFVNSCYIAHLCAIDRQLALDLGCYGDSVADGSHDWDTFTRFLVAGCEPVHLPEVLYAWRMHSGSTAGNISSKPYVVNSQRGVLTRFLEARAIGERFRVEKSPLFGATPDWWLRRMPVDPRPITTVLYGDARTPEISRTPAIDPRLPHEVKVVSGPTALDELKQIASDCGERHGLLHLLSADVEVDGTDWPWEAIGLMELFSDTAIVGGRVHDGARVLSGGMMFGFGRGCDSPDRGRRLKDPGYFAQSWKPHSVSGVSAQHAVIDPHFLARALESLEGLPVSMSSLGQWLGAAAARSGARVVYSPFVSCRSREHLDVETPTRETALFRVANADLIPERRLLSPHLGLTPDTAFFPVPEETRRLESLGDRTAVLDYQDWLTAKLAARRHRYSLSTRVPSLSVLTTVYSRTSAPLFATTAKSVTGQTLPSFEWIVLAHGNISLEVQTVLADLQKDSRVRVLRLADNLGIVGGMRHCLLAASGEYIVPVDADDLLTPDALHVFASVIGGREAPPMLVYSDEDVLRGDQPESPFTRPDFDPVLNLETSYIWHLCAIRRDAALTHDLYSDSTMEYCHDWDSVSRLALLEEPVHIPEVLYHWRHHEVSHTNRAGQHPGSLDSTRSLLERRAATLPNARVVEVAQFPIFRGAVEWYIRRKHIEPPAAAVVIKNGHRGLAGSLAATVSRSSFPFRSVSVLGSDADLQRTLAELALGGQVKYVAVLSADVRPLDDEWMWEAVRLFECHPAVAVCGGRLIDPRERVIASAGVLDESGTLVQPFIGLGRLDPGPFALALKPHLVATVPDAFYVIAMDALPVERAEDRTSALHMSAAAWAQERTVAYSPLIEGRATDSSALQVDAGIDYDVRALAGLRRTLAGRRQGAGGFVHRP